MDEREVDLVRHLAPKLHGFYVGFGIPENQIPQSPRTFEDVFRPLEQMNEIGTNKLKP
jgi:hypothetical protein